jgi:2-hydroxychromene-2-carboxylate isomerase
MKKLISKLERIWLERGEADVLKKISYADDVTLNHLAHCTDIMEAIGMTKKEINAVYRAAKNKAQWKVKARASVGVKTGLDRRV